MKRSIVAGLKVFLTVFLFVAGVFFSIFCIRSTNEKSFVSLVLFFVKLTSAISVYVGLMVSFWCRNDFIADRITFGLACAIWTFLFFWIIVSLVLGVLAICDFSSTLFAFLSFGVSLPLCVGILAAFILHCLDNE